MTYLITDIDSIRPYDESLLIVFLKNTRNGIECSEVNFEDYKIILVFY
jgi:hypothetical protein